MLMLQKLRKLRTNENVLIAVDVLLHSKSAFMNVFLMAFLMRNSVGNSPVGFIVYCIVRYALMAFFAIFLLRFIKRHTLAAWRISMIFSVLQIVAILLLDQTASYFVYILAVFNAFESTLYWRPKMYFDVTEVSPDRRLRFKSLGQIFIEIAKVLMPIVLGVVISDSSYAQAGIIILVISIMQLFLSILFRPAARSTRQTVHSPLQVYKMIMRHESLCKVYIIQLLRGLLTASAAYIIIAQYNVYASTGSDLDLGIFTAIASAISIVIIFTYQRLHSARVQHLILIMLAPAAVVLPLFLIFFPQNVELAIVFYVYTQSIIESFYNSTVILVRLQNLLNRHIPDDSYRLEIESMSEVALSIGRVISQTILLFIITIGAGQFAMYLALVEGLLIVPTIMLAQSKRDLAQS